MSAKEDDADDAFWEGVWAWREHVYAASCPYPAGTLEYRFWHAGMTYGETNGLT